MLLNVELGRDTCMWLCVSTALDPSKPPEPTQKVKEIEKNGGKVKRKKE
jgi:hypothetical protein